MTDTTLEINKWSNSILQKWIKYFENDTIQLTLRSKMIDPILNHILNRIFPYIILICVMFALLLLSVLITLGVNIFQMRSAHFDNVISVIKV
jgi:ABC-type antimicrobial peptide transport system permease subunit